LAFYVTLSNFVLVIFSSHVAFINLKYFMPTFTLSTFSFYIFVPMFMVFSVDILVLKYSVLLLLDLTA